MLDRRELMKRAGMAALVTGLGSQRAFALDTVTLPFDNGGRPLVRYPQKRLMIGLTERPPQLETPFAIFNDGTITPNNAFFVRYHLADVPYDIDPDKFTLEIKGKVDKLLKLSLKDIKKLKPVELVAVNQCSGNSRGFSTPRVAGGQLGNGAMGNARWRGGPCSIWPACRRAPSRSPSTAWTVRSATRHPISSRRSTSTTPATAR
jgi:sulfite dehydrogenase